MVFMLFCVGVAQQIGVSQQPSLTVRFSAGLCIMMYWWLVYPHCITNPLRGYSGNTFWDQSRCQASDMCAAMGSWCRDSRNSLRSLAETVGMVASDMVAWHLAGAWLGKGEVLAYWLIRFGGRVAPVVGLQNWTVKILHGVPCSKISKLHSDFRLSVCFRCWQTLHDQPIWSTTRSQGLSIVTCWNLELCFLPF